MADNEPEPFEDLEFDLCEKCGQQKAFIYQYRGKKYCHECFRPIAEVVREKIDTVAEVKPDDYIFAPGIDDETRVVHMDWAIVELFKKGMPNGPEVAYAIHKTGYLHPDLINGFKKLLGEKKIKTNLTKKEKKRWEEYAEEYDFFKSIMDGSLLEELKQEEKGKSRDN